MNLKNPTPVEEQKGLWPSGIPLEMNKLGEFS
jgi:hypothetical protein